MIRSIFVGGLFILLATSPVYSADLGITLDTLLEKFKAEAASQQITLEIYKLNCAENPKPGDPSKKIISCSHGLGGRSLIITNADPSGPLHDIATQMWDGGKNGDAAKVMAALAASLNGGNSSDYLDQTNAAVEKATTENVATLAVGSAEFIAMSIGKQLMITVSPK